MREKKEGKEKELKGTDKEKNIQEGEQEGKRSKSSKIKMIVATVVVDNITQTPAVVLKGRKWRKIFADMDRHKRGERNNDGA